ncbi:hypothetical protein TNCV_4090171 [Trichonephila clavipes]|uniref:Uncharacterized protein n=1 Tax=Trichonephila clavipes TaxID=2585209 RepID=A0A8X6S916_TRICX|nr:hypothetical protein TNCV_4090171 [Trichonephila clavipes]
MLLQNDYKKTKRPLSLANELQIVDIYDFSEVMLETIGEQSGEVLYSPIKAVSVLVSVCSDVTENNSDTPAKSGIGPQAVLDIN